MKRLAWALGTLVLAGCNGGPNKTNIELIQNMMDQPSIKSQDWIPEQGDKGQMRMPPKHSVPTREKPYAFYDDFAGAEKNPNPIAVEEKSLATGHKYYEIHCTPCHASTGAGDGLVGQKMLVKPRNLINADAKKYTDGRIFHAITAGRGVMRAYGAEIPDATVRWSIVNYVRSLQK